MFGHYHQIKQRKIHRWWQFWKSKPVFIQASTDNTSTWFEGETK